MKKNKKKSKSKELDELDKFKERILRLKAELDNRKRYIDKILGMNLSKK